MAKALDLTNQRFGKLVALSKAPSRKGNTYWLCQCDCGNVKEIQTGHLTSGATKSCGACMGEPFSFQNCNLKRNCILCGKEFIANTYNRQYCYDCSPKGLSGKEAVKRKKRILKHQLIQYKGGKCQKCGYDKCEGALQFHHRNPEEKDFSLSDINLNNTTTSIQQIYQEIDKCDLLCANCHFEEHYSQEN